MELTYNEFRDFVENVLGIDIRWGTNKKSSFVYEISMTNVCVDVTINIYSKSKNIDFILKAELGRDNIEEKYDITCDELWQECVTYDYIHYNIGDIFRDYFEKFKYVKCGK